MATDYDTDETATDESPSLSLENLPSELLLGCCSFLDARGLGRLEMSARTSLGEQSDRAWKQLTAGVPRGGLAGCLDKRFAIAHARARALFPSSFSELYADRTSRPVVQLDSWYDEFVFSWGFFWRESMLDGESLQSVLFEHLTVHLKGDTPPLSVFEDFNISNTVFPVPDDALGHAMLKPHLKRSQVPLSIDFPAFYDTWSPVAVLICTRKRDGAVAEICRFDGLDDEDGINSMFTPTHDRPYGNLCFEYTDIHLPRTLEGISGLGWEVIEYFEEVNSTATVVFDQSTGHLRYVFTSFLDAASNDVPPPVISLILHGLCDEAVRG